MSEKFFNNRKGFNNYNENRQEQFTKSSEANAKETNIQEVKVQEQHKEREIDKINYLNIDKKPEEKLVADGSIFKHGTVVNCNVLNFRKKPNKESEIIHTFTVGENILYSETDDPNWFKVKDKDGVIGYCMMDYIKVEM